MAQIETFSARLPDIDAAKSWAETLPSPLALPFVRIRPQLEKAETGLALVAGLDALEATLKWSAIVSAADILQKLRADHPHARRDTLASVFPPLFRILGPSPSLRQWLRCADAILESYLAEPDLFAAPALVEHLRATGGSLVGEPEHLDTLVAVRSRLARGELSTDEIASAWSTLDRLLGALRPAVDAFVETRLIQLNGLSAPAGESSVVFPRHLCLRGYRMEEADLTAGPIRVPLEGERLVMRQLYLFDAALERRICLYPFLFFGFGAPRDSAAGYAAGTFFFQEMRHGALAFASHAGDRLVPSELELRLDAQSDDGQSFDAMGASIFQLFQELRALTATDEAARAVSLPGFPARSNVLSFQRTVEFHTEAFSGRTEYFERIEHAIAGPFRCVWITGFAGYGKSALMSRLSQQHPGSIVYFVSPERGAAEASTFLRHVCQSIIERFGFADVISNEQLASVSELKTLFDDLLARANDALAGGNEKLVLLIDGLDESLRYASRAEECLDRYLPENRDAIGERVVFIITSRPEEVSLSHLADLTLELKPFAREQVATILAHYGWDEATADVAYRKSDGQPIYFRFLLDDVKRGLLKKEDAAQLPSGIVDFYERLWRDASAAKTGPERLIPHVLGFLAAAAEALTEADLHELLSDIDPQITLAELRQVMSKSHLGRFVIGSRRFSLFHDTLREFVSRKTRPQHDDQPYGEGLHDHELLARWCAQTINAEYGDRYRLYHLLHARRFRETVELVEDRSPKGLFSRRMNERNGSTKLMRELAYASAAARELNDLNKIFGFSLLAICMRKLKKTAATPDAVGIMSGLGLGEELLGLLDAAENNNERWELAATVFVHALRTHNSRLADSWVGQLKKIWFEAQAYDKATLLIALLKKLPAEDALEEHVARVFELFADTQKSYLPRVYAEGLQHAPVLAARRLFELDTRKAEEWYVGDKLLELAHVLTLEGASEEHVALGWRVLSLVSLRNLDVGISHARGLLERDAERTLASLRPSQFALDDWYPIVRVASFLRMLVAVAPERVDAYLAEQGSDVRVLGLCLRATIDGLAASCDVAVRAFWEECEALSTVNVLACLALLTLVDERQRPGVKSAFAIATSRLLETIVSRASSFEIDEESLRQQLKLLLPRALGFARELSALVADSDAALWLAVAAASPALEPMLDDRVRGWLQSKCEQSDSSATSIEADEILKRVSAKLSARLEYTNGRSAVHSLIVPVLFTLAPLSDFAERLRSTSPFATLAETDVAVLNPQIYADQSRSAALYPYFVRDTYVVGVDSIVERGILQLGFTDPSRVIDLWDASRSVDGSKLKAERRRLGLESEQATDEDGDFDGGEAFDGGEEAGDPGATFDPAAVYGADPIYADALAHLLIATGRGVEALRIVASGRASGEIWTLFPRFCPDQHEHFLRELPMICENVGYVPSELLSCLAEILDHAPTEPRLGWIETLLADERLPATVRLELARYALAKGASGVALRYLEEVIDERPNELSDRLVNVLAPWLESVLPRSTRAAAEMWESVLGFLRGRSLEFLEQLQRTFDNKICVQLERTETPPRALGDLAHSLGDGFDATKRLAAIAMIEDGWEREQVEPLLAISTLADKMRLAQKLSPAKLPDWVRTLLFDHVRADVESLSPLSDDAYDAFDFAVWPGFDELQRGELLRAFESRFLESVVGAIDDPDDVEFVDDWRALVRAVSSGDYHELTERSEEALEDKVAYIAELNPALCWAIARVVFSDATRRENLTSIVRAAIEHDPAWASEIFARELDEQNAVEIAELALKNTKVDDWSAIGPLVAAAFERLPRELELYSMRTLFVATKRRWELTIPLLRRLKDKLGWIDYFCQPTQFNFDGDAKPSGELFVRVASLELDRWCDQIRGAGTDPTVEQYTLSYRLAQLLHYLAQLTQSPQTSAIVSAIVASIETVIEARKGERESLLDQLLKNLAALDPGRALDWVKRFDFKGYQLAEVLREIVVRAPERFGDVYQDVLRKREEWTRRSAVIACTTALEFSTALEWRTREGLDPEQFAFEQAKLRTVDGQQMAQLVELVGGARDKRFKLYMYALRLAGRIESDAHREWLEYGWAVVNDGEFVEDQYERIRFQIVGDPTLFPYMEVDLFATLFGFWPAKFDERMEMLVREADPQLQPTLQNAFDDIRSNAVELLFEASPQWMLRHAAEWSGRSWWPYLSDTLFATINALPAEEAIAAIGSFNYVESHRFEAILQRIEEPDEMRECLEALLTTVLLRKPEQMEMIVELALSNLDRAALEPIEILIGWANQFCRAKELIGLQASSLVALFERLKALADDAALDSVGASTTGGQVELSDQQRAQIASLDATIRTLLENGQDPTLFVNLRNRILSDD
ncbi:MAG: ATP-binding protein [Myxococcales bacterium]|nr:ATP-binding protein [Myxococcales bacterium]